MNERLRCRGDGVVNDLSALGRVSEHMPNLLRDIFEGLFETFGLILGINAYSCDIFDLANKDDLDPSRVCSVTTMENFVSRLMLACLLPGAILLTSRHMTPGRTGWNPQSESFSSSVATNESSPSGRPCSPLCLGSGLIEDREYSSSSSRAG